MRRLLTSVAAVALCVGGVVVPGSASAATPPPPRPEPCPATQLPLGADASVPGAPRLALPPVGDTLLGDELATPGLLVPPGVPAPPAVRATSWLVADLETGQVPASCNAHVPFAPASTLKVLTALALLPGLDPAAVHTAGRASAQVGGSRAGVVARSQYTVDDLAHGLMLASGNDAAVALGELVGPDAALARMTQTARDLGAVSTVPHTLNGLDAPGQVSTAHDLAVLARAALDEPRVAGPASTVRYTFPAAGRVGDPARGSFQIQTSSRLLRNYPGATGLKSGYTRAAGGSYVGTAERDGRRYVATVMRSQDSSWRLSAQLLDWAFATGGAGGAVGGLAVAGLPEASRARGEDAGDQGALPGPSTPGVAPDGPSAAASADPGAGDGPGDELGGVSGDGDGPGAGDEAGAGDQESEAASTADPLDAITGAAGSPAEVSGASTSDRQVLVLAMVLLAAVAAPVVGVLLRRRAARRSHPPSTPTTGPRAAPTPRRLSRRGRGCGRRRPRPGRPR